MRCLCKIIQTQIFSLSREILPTCVLQNGVTTHTIKSDDCVDVNQHEDLDAIASGTSTNEALGGSSLPATWRTTVTAVRLISGLRSPPDRPGNSQWGTGTRGEGLEAVSRRQLGLIDGQWRTRRGRAAQLGKASWWGTGSLWLGRGRVFGSAAAAVWGVDDCMCCGRTCGQSLCEVAAVAVSPKDWGEGEKFV